MDNSTLYILIAAIGGVVVGGVIAFLVKLRASKREHDLTEELNNRKLLTHELKNKLAEMESQFELARKNFETKKEIFENEKIGLKAELTDLKQKNLELDQLLKEGQPMIHSLKLRLIEANNNLARYKGRFGNL